MKLSSIKFFIFIGMLLAMAGSMNAGVKEDADSLYGAYCNALQSEMGKDYEFSLLNDCCRQTINLIKSPGIAVDDYIAAKERLRKLHPQLQIGGVYFSQHNNHVLGVSLLEQYISIPKLEAFKNELFSLPEHYPSLLYYVASNKFNSQDFEQAITFLKEYLETHELKNERNALIFLSRAYGYMLDDENQILILMQGVQKYPSDPNLLHDIVRYHIKSRNTAQAELYLPAYEATNPNPTELYSLKAGIAEIKGDYLTSLKISEALYASNVNNIDYAKMLARSSYNYVVMEMKNGRTTPDGKPDSSLTPYLENAAKLFVIINNNKPEKAYLDGLIDTYLMLGRRDEAMLVAKRIGRQIDEKRSNKLLAEQASSNATASGKVTSSGIPVFSQFLSSYIDENLRIWMQKGAFEKKSDYEERTSGEMLEAKKKSIVKDAKEAYIRQFSGTMQVKNITIGGYDADHEVYLIKYNLGNMLVHVPLQDEQAQKFQDDWLNNRVRPSEPKFDIAGDSLILSGLTFVSQSGATYRYDINESLKYEDVDVKITNPISILTDDLLAGIAKKEAKQIVDKTTIEVGNNNRKSDIDIDIPSDSIVNKFTFALIISNEDYRFVDKVNYAIDDGKSMTNYCRKVLGIPKKNIFHISNASYLEMKGEIKTFCDLAKEYADSARLIVYYSGHGIPKLETQEAFMLAVDGSPLTMSGSILLNDFYNDLASTGARSVNVFLDCCFSGASKSGNMLTAARGTVIKPKSNEPQGNMVVMTACSGDEIAFHYTDQHHGMFTYFLLKKLKETQGKANLGEIFEYVQNNVRRQSLHDKKRKQIPNVEFAPALSSTWKSLTLK